MQPYIAASLATDEERRRQAEAAKESARRRARRRTAVFVAFFALFCSSIPVYNFYLDMRSKLPWAYFIDIDTGEAFLLSGTQATIGRLSSAYNNTVNVKPRFVSLMHAIVTKDYKIFDMCSLNSTTVNTGFIKYGTGGILKNGDVVVLANASALQFFTLTYPLYQFWHPEPPIKHEKAQGWAIFVDGYHKKATDLVLGKYFIKRAGQDVFPTSEEGPANC